LNTLVKDNERLYNIESNGIISQVIINNSPYAHCHSLIIPEPEMKHIQFLTGETIEMACELGCSNK